MKVALWCLDFGGVIDSDGVHNRTQFWTAVQTDIRGRTQHEFQQAYTVADRTLLETGAAENASLFELNYLMFHLIATHLRIFDPAWVLKGASFVTDVQSTVIERLSKIAPIVIISNFTGNLKTILRDFRIDPFVTAVIESFHETRISQEKIEKPDIRMFQKALNYLPQGAQLRDAVMVGDNFERDLKPAALLGMQTVWIHPSDCPNLRRLEETLQTRNPKTVHDSSTQR
jgi:putative hydrolase of the HAD superfamily